MRFVLVSTEDSSKRPINIPDEIVVRTPRIQTKGISNGKPDKIRKRTTPKKIRKPINKAKATQRSKSVITKHGSVHHRN